MLVVCQDCGDEGDEAPDDPAPRLCPGCYGERLAKIAEQFEGMADSLGHPTLICMWLEEALIEVAGERPEWAHLHAAQLYGEMTETEARSN